MNSYFYEMKFNDYKWEIGCKVQINQWNFCQNVSQNIQQILIFILKNLFKSYDFNEQYIKA